MINKWKINIAFALLGSLLVLSVPSQILAKGTSSTSVNHLTDTITAEVKGILNEQTAEGARIGVVVRLYNEGSQITRVPSYGLKITTKDGEAYTLNPSAANTNVLQPKEKAELSYMITVNRDDAFSLSVLSWVRVDNTVYPRKETQVLTVPIDSIEWKGENAGITRPDEIKKWGSTFTIPMFSDNLVYTPVYAIQQNTLNGPALLLVLRVENRSYAKQWIPDFSIDGMSGANVYPGKRLEQGAILLQPGEKQYINYAISTENHAVLKSLLVLTPEAFDDNKTVIHYTIGRLGIRLPNVSDGQLFMNQLKPYDWNKQISFDPLNKLIPANVDVSLIGLRVHKGEGYNAIVADFNLQNRNTHAIPVPNFQAELMGAGGSSYIGTRQSIAAQSLIPNIQFTASYYFIVPSSEKGDQLAMEILDGDSSTPLKFPIAAFRTQVQSDNAGSLLSFYPYSVKLNNWSVQVNLNDSKSGNAEPLWMHKLKLDLTIDRENGLILDQSFKNMTVELVDQQGESIGSQTLSFTGENRLSSGQRTIVFNSDTAVNSVTVLIYETFSTPYGEAKRLWKKLQ